MLRLYIVSSCERGKVQNVEQPGHQKHDPNGCIGPAACNDFAAVTLPILTVLALSRELHVQA
jgi:hypothetical protein